MIRPKIGLALGSGIARGWAHIGVLRALMRAGITPDIVCGTSIGALVGGVYLSGHLDTLEEWALGLNRLRMARYLDVQLGGGGLIGGRRLTALLRENLGDTLIESLPLPFAAVATELTTGHEVWLQQGHVVDAIRASYALPGVFSPVRVDARMLVDGALVNPVPVSVCRALGARLVIAVNLNADTYGKGRAMAGEDNGDEAELLDHGAADVTPPAHGAGLMVRQLFGRDKNAPSMFGVMVGALNIIQDRLSRSRLAGDPADVIVAPRLGNLGLLEFHRAEEAITEGEAAFDRALPELREALRLLS